MVSTLNAANLSFLKWLIICFVNFISTEIKLSEWWKINEDGFE